MCEYCDNKCDTCMHRHCEVVISVKYRRECLASNRVKYEPYSNFCHHCGEPLTEAKPLSLDELRKMNDERVWVQFQGIGMYGLVSYLTDEEYSADEEFEQVWITNSLGGRNSYDDILDQGGIIYDRQPRREETAK